MENKIKKRRIITQNECEDWHEKNENYSSKIDRIIKED